MNNSTTKSPRIIAIAEEIRTKTVAIFTAENDYDTFRSLLGSFTNKLKYRGIEVDILKGFRSKQDFLLTVDGVEYASTGHKVLAIWKTSFFYDGEQDTVHWKVLDISPCFITFHDHDRVRKARYKLGSYFDFSSHLGAIRIPDSYHELLAMLDATQAT